MSEKIEEKLQVGSNPFATPTDDKLASDAASLTDQYIHYWNKGEVQCVVILVRPDSLRPICAYSAMPKERLMKILQLTEAEQVLRAQRTLIEGKKDRR